MDGRSTVSVEMPNTGKCQEFIQPETLILNIAPGPQTTTGKTTLWTFSKPSPPRRWTRYLPEGIDTKARHHVYTLLQDGLLYYAPLGDKVDVSWLEEAWGGIVTNSSSRKFLTLERGPESGQCMFLTFPL